MGKITPFLWFDGQAEEAAEFYCSLFEDSKITQITRYGPGTPGPEGTVMTVAFRLAGQSFVGLNGGPQFKFTEAVSFAVACEDQAEIDRLWGALTADGGRPSVCGWLKDKYGLSWQITPKILPEVLAGGQERTNRVMQVVMKMTKPIIADLQAAYDGE